MADHANWFCFTQAEQEQLFRILYNADPRLNTEVEAIRERLQHYLSEGALNQAYRNAAEDQSYVREGEVEVDDKAVVSESDEGAYVMGWIWVPREDAYPDERR